MPEQQRQVLKFAFAAATVMYIVIVEILVHSGGLKLGAGGQDLVRIMGPILAGVYVVSVLFALPLVVKNQKPQSTLIMNLAFYESGAIYGLLLSFISGSPYYVIGFGIVAMGLILFKA